MNACEVTGLTKVWPGFTLKDVSFALPSGTVTGFIGRNGAGKTTAIKAMLGLVHPDAGAVRMFGTPLTGNEAAVRQRIGYSSGAVNYYPRRRLKTLAAVTRSFYPAWDEDVYRRWLSRFALDEEKTPLQLSEGMRVKVNLLMALSHRAELLILDEPTSGLDPFSRDELTDLFLALKEEGVTILFSTHLTSDLEKCADSLIYLRGGAVAFSGTRNDFDARLRRDNETLEQTFLRLEKEART